MDHVQFTLIHEPNIPGSYAILFFTGLKFTFITRWIHNWESVQLGPTHFILSGAISSCPPLLPKTYWTLSDLGLHLLVSYLFAFLYSSWGSHSKYAGVVCQSLLQGITFCQHSPLWPISLAWPCKVWLIASLSYPSPFTMTSHWSMKRMDSINPVLLIKVYLNMW